MKLSHLVLGPAFAAAVLSPLRGQGAAGDLILGFVPNATVASGATLNLEVDLGSVTAFLNAAQAGSATYTLASLGADLAATYGSNWASTGLAFGVVGSTGTAATVPGVGAKTDWATSTIPSGPGSQQIYAEGNNQSSLSRITAMYGGSAFGSNAFAFGGASVSPLSDLSSQVNALNGATLQGFTVPLGGGAAFSSEMGATSPFGIPGTSSGAFLTTVSSGAGAELLQMNNAVNGGTATDLGGQFQLSSTGVLSYVAGAAPAASRIVNFSIRAVSAPGAGVLTVGFVVSDANKPLLIRAVGPGLTAYGVPGTIAQPQLQLFQGSNVLASNTGWSSAANAAQVSSVAAQVGAFPLLAGAADCALYTTLGAGVFTLQVSDVAGGSGVALAELYDANATGSARLINVSARTQAGVGASALIAGFVVEGSAPETVLIRAVGPSLAGYGVPGAMADPRVDVYASGASTPFTGNDNWGGAASLAQTFAQVQAFPLDPASRDAALVLTVNPGAYTAVVSGADGGTGVALLEVYEVR